MNNGYYNDQQRYAPQPVYAPMPDAEVTGITDSAFGKGLAAAIMAWFPIASIIAIIFGSKAISLVAQARSLAASRRCLTSKKLISARVLGRIGLIAGIVMTSFWAAYLIIFVLFLEIFL